MTAWGGIELGQLAQRRALPQPKVHMSSGRLQNAVAHLASVTIQIRRILSCSNRRASRPLTDADSLNYQPAAARPHEFDREHLSNHMELPRLPMLLQ